MPLNKKEFIYEVENDGIYCKDKNGFEYDYDTYIVTPSDEEVMSQISKLIYKEFFEEGIFSKNDMDFITTAIERFIKETEIFEIMFEHYKGELYDIFKEKLREE